MPLPPQPPVVEASYGSLDIVWQSNFKGSHVRVVAGTVLNLTWEATSVRQPHSLLRCSADAFDTCAVDQCQLLVPETSDGSIVYPTELIDGEPVTGALFFCLLAELTSASPRHARCTLHTLHAPHGSRGRACDVRRVVCGMTYVCVSRLREVCFVARTR
jgi:hypothetical protein